MTKVLVAFATRFGSTREIASAIAAELIAEGIEAVAAEATSSLNPDDYDAFVIGSPLYGRKWMSVAGMFAAITSERINGKPVVLFSVGTLGVGSPEAGRTEHDEFVARLKEVAPKLNVISDEVFTGYFERSNLPWYLRIIDRFAPTPQGDHRDWAAIHAWANLVATKFKG
ncbi:flavodoxin domain-containing protein [Candidatus Lucifugimonas marina]|uniref:Flavodoxin-like domain-containing protein n=1 Tax=Candidatus Lucifugimonas marina TaxID=3038979 RepID=A0AAJ5ZCT7_9CHLR|nr:hypothetical protein [SAR202 cluster bacterium JH702]MDG0868422.1 hypothetical protein [SAR202 cluster bacterium JH639]WFG35055.1 hypothetical protein GKN94_04915 [SAR202 cluster bacterium JH545]WFG39012.1 hypothetical protein GKO48_05080 [SAR202 cluster bacterium JH1073]